MPNATSVRYTFDLERLNGETNGDNGLTILNGLPECVPAPGSFDGDMVIVQPNTIRLNSGPVGSWGRSESMQYCTFDLDAETGKIYIFMEDMSVNPWAKKSKNRLSYAENTKAFLEDYVVSTNLLGGKRAKSRSNGKRTHRANRKTVKRRKLARK